MKDTYAGAKPVPRGDADTATTTLKRVHEEDGTDPARSAGYSTDGCPVLTGIHNGAWKQLTAPDSSAPLGLTWHCTGHKQNLSEQAAAKAVPYLTNKYFDTARLIPQHYEWPNTRSNSLAETGVTLAIDEAGVESAGALIKGVATRWNSQGASSARIFANAAIIVVDLTLRSSAEDLCIGPEDVGTAFRERDVNAGGRCRF